MAGFAVPQAAPRGGPLASTGVAGEAGAAGADDGTGAIGVFPGTGGGGEGDGARAARGEAGLGFGAAAHPATSAPTARLEPSRTIEGTWSQAKSV